MCVVFVAAAAGRSQAAPIQLILNGGFETGTFASWTVTDQALGSGSFFINPNDGITPAPLSGIGGALAFNPLGGMFFATSDQTGPGAHAITQSFVVPAMSTVALSFDMFMNDFSAGVNPTVDPSGLDYTVLPAINQHARVEILTAAAAALSTAPADIVASILVPLPAPAIPAGINPWVSSPVFDLTGLLGGGGAFQIRFAEVDNSGFLTFGVDNVSILADTAAIPKPTSLALLGMTAAGFCGVRTRRRRTDDTTQAV